MADDTISVTASCGKCGNRLSWDDESSDDTMIVCPNCGAEVGTYGRLKEKAVAAAKDEVIGILKKSLKLK